MKILIVVPSLKRGGAERVASLLSLEWSRENKVDLAIFDTQGMAYNFGGQLIDLQLPSKKHFRQKLTTAIQRIYQLYILIKEANPDKIYSIMESANFPIIIACLFAGISKRLYVSIHTNPKRISPKSHQFLLRYLYRLPKMVITASSGIRESLIDTFGISKNKTYFIPNPVDIEKIDEQKSLPIQIKHHADLLSGTLFLGVGRLNYQKRFDKLIDAFAMISSDYDCRLIILGEGADRKRLEERISQLGLSTVVMLPGAVDNPFPYYSNATAFVLSSEYEGWGNVVVEAMACGCPTISFDCDFGPREITSNGKYGQLVPSGNIEELAAAMANIIDDSDYRHYLKMKGLERAKSYDVRFVADQTLRL